MQEGSALTCVTCGGPTGRRPRSMELTQSWAERGAAAQWVSSHSQEGSPSPAVAVTFQVATVVPPRRPVTWATTVPAPTVDAARAGTAVAESRRVAPTLNSTEDALPLKVAWRGALVPQAERSAPDSAGSVSVLGSTMR